MFVYMPDEVEIVADDDALYRWISPQYVKKTGAVSSGAYMRWSRVGAKFTGQPDPEPSVDLARLTTPEAMQPRAAPGTRIGTLVARSVRVAGLDVVHRPDRDQNNPAHCVITGVQTADHCRLLADATRILL